MLLEEYGVGRSSTTQNLQSALCGINGVSLSYEWTQRVHWLRAPLPVNRLHLLLG